MNKNGTYIIHLHDAKKAGKHYDLRLTINNTTHSFTLPKMKIPGIDDVVLAIKSYVEYDVHKINPYRDVIPDGEYGAGTLKTIETGKFEVLDWPTDSSKIVLYFPSQTGGQYLVGTYYFVKTKENHYIFGKKKN